MDRRAATTPGAAARRAPLLLTLALVTAAGCLSPRPAINRVQPDYLDKNDLVPHQYAALTAGDSPQTVSPTLLAKEPVFYTQTTLIAKPTTTGFTGLTSYSQSDKIRWEVSEHFLIARQSYEFVRNAPRGTGGIGGQVQTGDPVAVFAIKSHFDIRHAYNTTTGEELNVVEENSIDRPWYLRRYMRVDWSQNLITGYNSVFIEADLNGKVDAEPVPVFVNSPTDPNAPTFEYAGSGDDRKLLYFDVVNRAILHPETTYLSYSDRPGSTTVYSKLPICWLNEKEGATDCAPAEATFRLAFRRTDPSRDYEPAPVNVPLPGQAPFNHLDMERFGFFEQARVGYDPTQHATLDNQRMHFASRHNLWVHHHLQAYSGDAGAPCNADAECGGANQVCRIGNSPLDASHRGRCATLGLAHLPTDPACRSDDDCLQTATGGGVSKTAVCDPLTKTCGEHYIRCTSDTTCQAIDKQSSCDLASAYNRTDNNGLCLMPFRQRQVRPIAYHESTGFPDYMQPVTESVVSEWNDAFVTAVTAARRHECELEKGIDPTSVALADNPCNAKSVTGLDPALGADARFPLVGCHSPVWGTAEAEGKHTQAEVDAAHARGWDLPACGPQGTNARIGDLRYSMIGAITDHDAQGYWGLANIASDPETGEMVVGRGAVWQTVTDTYASYLVQLVRVLTGDLQPDALADGSYVVTAMKQLGSGKTPADQVLDEPLRRQGALGEGAPMPTGLDKLVLPGNGWFTPESGLTLWSKDTAHPGAFARGYDRLLGGRVLGDGSARGTQRLLSLAGTPLEGRLMNGQQVLLAQTGSPDKSGTLPQTLAEASPMRGQSLAVRQVLERYRTKLAQVECAYEAAFSDDILLGFAQRLAKGKKISPQNPEDAGVTFGREWDFSGGGKGTDWALMQQYAAQFIQHGVLAHELGHSIGQRHNFNASADAVNYFDQYWKARGLGHPKGVRPRYEYLADPDDGQFYSQAEVDARVEEWGYSSVMDYKGLNEDAHGIGRYDYAFVKNGYVNLVEAFKTVANTDKALAYAMNTQGAGLSTPLDTVDWSKGGLLHGLHYTQIPEIFGKAADGSPNIGDANRYDVFLRETVSQDLAGFGSPPFTNLTADGHLLVPYRFDSDNRAGLIWQCQRYDAGGDAFESLHYVSERMLNYYFATSYARLRSGFSTRGYVNRLWGRYLEQLRQCTQTLAFDLVNFQDFFGATSSKWLTYRNDPKQYGGYVNQQVMKMSVNAITGLLTMPEMGQHALVRGVDGTAIYSPSFTSRSVDIPINEGRAFESNWRQDVGFFWYEALNRAGSYYDKVASIQALTSPDLFLLSRDTPSDIRLFELSYYTMFPDQMIRLFGALLAEDYQDFSPIWLTNEGTIQRTDVSSITLPAGAGPGQSGRVFDTHHVAMDPQAGFTVQMWALIHSMAQFPATYDQRYVDYARLWVDGSVEAITVKNPDVNTVSFDDPWSHITYRALHFGTREGEAGVKVGSSAVLHNSMNSVANEAGIAARVLLRLADLDAARLAAIAKLDNTAAQQLEIQEQQYLDLVHAMRDTTAAFGHGYAVEPN